MQCRKCKAELLDGETFCRRCATSIYVDDKLIDGIKDCDRKKHKIMNISLGINNNEKIMEHVMSNKELVNRKQNDIEYARKSLTKSLIKIFLLLALLVIVIVFIIIKL